VHYPDPHWLSAGPRPPSPGDPHQWLAALRAAGPIHRDFMFFDLRGWLVVRYDLARAALNHPGLVMRPLDKGPGLAAPDAYPFACDPPEHARIRGLLTEAVAPRRAQRLAPQVRRIAVELLDALRGPRVVDIVHGYAGLLPGLVLCELLGVPPAYRSEYRRWAFQAFETSSARGEAVATLRELLRSMIVVKSRAPGGDLLSDLLAARDRTGAPPAADEVIDIALTVSAAVCRHVSDLLVDALTVLLRHPEQTRRLCDRPELLPTAVEEVLRYVSPAGPGPLRFAAEDLDLGGVRVRRGEPVAVSLASAGRDAPAYGGDPSVFDVTRGAVRHLAFGDGPHRCPGTLLARLTASIAVITLFVRHPRVTPEGPPPPFPADPSRRPRSLRVRLGLDG